MAKHALTAHTGPEELVVALADTLEVDLMTNPSTGYVWFFDAAGEGLLAFLGTDRAVGANNEIDSLRIGGESLTRWSFLSQCPGEFTLTF